MKQKIIKTATHLMAKAAMNYAKNKLQHAGLMQLAKHKEEVWNVGDLVIQNKTLAVVVDEKTIATIAAQEGKWQFMNLYCPYLHEVGYNGDCGLKTQATSRSNGAENQFLVESLIRQLESHTRNTYGCPPPEYYIPAFDFCSSLGAGWYLPAFDELWNMFSNPLVAAAWRKYASLQSGKDYTKRELQIWSSTDNGHPTSENDVNYTEALALTVSAEGKLSEHSKIKSQPAMIIAFFKLESA